MNIKKTLYILAVSLEELYAIYKPMSYLPISCHWDSDWGSQRHPKKACINAATKRHTCWSGWSDSIATAQLFRQDSFVLLSCFLLGHEGVLHMRFRQLRLAQV